MPLVLDLVRHAEAEPAGDGRDAARPLSPRGLASLRSLGERLAGAGTRPERMFASPLVRAQQTASHLIAAAGLTLVHETMPELGNGAGPGAVIDALQDRGIVTGHVALVGHLPQIEDLHALLTGVTAPFPPATLRRIVFLGGPSAGAGRPVLVLRP